MEPCYITAVSLLNEKHNPFYSLCHSPIKIPRNTGFYVSIITPRTKYIMYTTVFLFILCTNTEVEFSNFIICAQVDTALTFLKQCRGKKIYI